MKTLYFIFALCAGLAVISSSKAGCLSGAAVGGVAGHVAGHHALLGAAVGCAVGHHRAAVQRRDQSHPPGENDPK
jgi:hypothetical protein